MFERHARRMRRVAVLVAASVACALAISAVAGPAQSADDKSGPKLYGVWKLNEAKSESMQKKMEELRASGGGGGGGGRGAGGGGFGGGGGGGWGGGGGRGGGGGGRGGGGGGRGMRGGGGAEGAAQGDAGQGSARPDNPDMRMLARPPFDLEVDQSDTSVVLIERGIVLEVLDLGGSHAAAVDLPLPAAAGGEGTPATAAKAPEYVAKWKGPELVAERTTARGAKMSERLDVSGDGKTLTIITRRESANGPALELKRVYDRYEGGE
jgi:hypothetical protein